MNYDLFGLADQFHFKFVRRYLDMGASVREAVTKYCDDIKKSDFPGDKESFG